jgi:hypothetical protein
MANRVYASCLKNIKHIVARFEGSLNVVVDMMQHEFVGVFIVATKHDMFGVFCQQRNQGIEILSGTSFTNKNMHACFEFFLGFFVGKTFMVG